MTKSKNVSFVLFLTLALIASLGVGIADAKVSKLVKRDARVAINVLKKTKDSVTTTINTSNTIIPEVRSLGACSGEIILNSPGWEGATPDDASYWQSEAALIFALETAIGRAVVQTTQASYWAQGSLRSAAKYSVDNRAIKGLLRGNANRMDSYRVAGNANAPVCDILNDWKDAGYTGIYNLVNAEWGTNALQNYTKDLRANYKKIFKGAVKVSQALKGRVNPFIASYGRASNAFINALYPGDMPGRKLPRSIG